MHKTELHPEIVEEILNKRGKLHVFDEIDPAKTALVVVDMQVAFVESGKPSEVSHAKDIVPNINRLAAGLRATGGTVVWIVSAFDENIATDWSSFIGGTYKKEHAERVVGQLREGADGHRLWPDMDRQLGDMTVTKNRFSAFLPGASDLAEQLRERGIENVLITGTLTNVCCESSARDAMMRNFNVVMVSDGNATYSDVLHNASLNSLAITFADIMTTDEVLQRLSAGVAEAAE